MTAKFTDLCLISKNVLNLVDFYEKLFDVTANEKGEYHSSVNFDGLRLTIDDADIADGDSDFSYVNCKASDNTIICFNVDDVDTAFSHVIDLGAETLNEPTTHLWGARSFQFRDPDGNIINFRTVPKGVS
jgi:uncharacterized glyoxalase superfamily protein PhnB